MARQRLNTQFLIKFGCASLVAAGVVYGAWRFHKPHNPAPYIAAGDEAMKRYDFNTAAQNYAVASDLLPQKEDLHLKLGRCYFQLEHAGVDRYQDAVNEFTRAEELNPDDADAWIGLLEINEFRVMSLESLAKDTRVRQELSMGLGMMRDAADHLVKLQPNSVQALSAGPILTIRTWLANLTMPETAEEKLLPADKRPTTEQRGEKAIADLTKLMADHPENEKIPYWLARAKIFQAQEAQRGPHPDQAPALFAEASKQFDADIAARPDVVGLFLGKASILNALLSLDNSPNNDYRKQLRETLQIAQGMVDPVKSPPDDYERAKVQWAENLRLSDVTGAEDVYRKLIEHFPDHLQLRNQLARMLEVAGRKADALVVLDGISTITAPSVTDIARRNIWDKQLAESRLVRANIEVDQLQSTPPGPDRDKLVKDINAALDGAQRQFAGTSRLLRVLGRFQMANGQRRDAIDTLTLAAEKMRVEGGGVDFMLLRDEAMAYAQGGQATRAVELLERAMIDPIVANNSEMHLLLAQMNLQNQDYSKAKPYIDWLVLRVPDDPQVLMLEIQELGPNPEWSKVEKFWAKLPEQNDTDKSLKASIASQLHNNDEAIKLFSDVNKRNPGDVNLTLKLVSCYQLQNNPDPAIAVLDACIALNPNNPLLPPLRDQLKPTKDPSLMEKDTLEAIGKIKDPFTKECAYVKFYRIHENPELQVVHLLGALKIQPDNKELLASLFILYIDSKRFPEAEAMLPHLTDLDVDNAHGLLFHCRLALAMNDSANAVIYGRQMTHDMPNFGASWEMYGEALMAAGELDLASEQFQTALQLQATNADAMSNKIKCNVMQGKTIAARSDLLTACKRFPSSIVFRDMRQRFEINYGDPESVIPELTAQIQDHPDDIDGYLMDIDALQACVRAKALLGNGQAAASYHDQARDRFEQATQKWPDDLRFANGFAQLYIQNKDLTNAEKVLIAIAGRDKWKDQPKPLILLGQVYMMANKMDLADDVLSKALREQPDSVEALLTMADCKRFEGKPDIALAVLEPGVGNLAVRAKYTELLLAMGRVEQAEYEVGQAIKAQPANYSLVNLMLEVYYAEASQGIPGKREQGLNLATDAINSQHANVYAYLWRAKLMLTGASDLDAARKDLTVFLTSVPNDAEAHRLTARILDSKNDRDGATRELEDAMKLAPQDKGIRLNLLSEYLSAVPPLNSYAQRLLEASLAIPAFSNDPDFEAQYALLQAQSDKDRDKAVATYQKALKDAVNQSALIPDYFRVLLLTKNYDLLLTESTKYFPDANKRPWFVYSDCALARVGMGDFSGAEVEFNNALNRAGTEEGSSAALTVATTICGADKPFGTAKALEMILPKAGESPLWQLVAVELYLANHDHVGALKEVDVAMGSIARLVPRDQFRLLQLASSVYLSAIPPMVDKALDANDKLLQMQPDNISALNDVACILVDMAVPPDPAKALTYSQKAYDLSTKNGVLDARIADTQGWVLIQNNMVNNGIDVLHKALDIYQYGKADFPEAHYHLGMGYMKIKQPGAALSELNSAKKLAADLIAKHEPVDPAFVAKIDAALKQATETAGVNADVKGAP